MINNLTSMNYSTWGIHYFQTNPFIYVYLWMSVIFPYTVYDINAWEIATKKLRTTSASPKNIENICAHDKMAQIDHQLANLGLHCLETVSLGEGNLQGNKRRTQRHRYVWCKNKTRWVGVAEAQGSTHHFPVGQCVKTAARVPKFWNVPGWHNVSTWNSERIESAVSVPL